MDEEQSTNGFAHRMLSEQRHEGFQVYSKRYSPFASIWLPLHSSAGLQVGTTVLTFIPINLYSRAATPSSVRQERKINRSIGP